MTTTSSLTFHNPGEIDIRGATILGLSAKDNPEAIGKFGTGLKYAIAQILAHNGQLEIWSGLDHYTFSLSPIFDFRGKDAQQIIMHGPYGKWAGAQPLGFTTHYGAHWTPRQIFRELYSNAVDEGGTVLHNTPCHHERGITVITVHGWPELIEEYYSKDELILPNTLEPVYATDRIRVFNRPTQHLYYRGVAVHTFEHSFPLTFDIRQDIELTEDRTLSSPVYYALRVGMLMGKCPDTELISKFIDAAATTPKNAVLGRSFGCFGLMPLSSACQEPFIQTAKKLYQKSHKHSEILKDIALRHFADCMEPTSIPPTDYQAQLLAKAIQLLSMTEVTHFPAELAANIFIAELPNETLAQVFLKTRNIYISPAALNQGLKATVSTLYEELTHLHTGHADCTYAMQTHLFDTIISLLAEHVFKEIL